MIVLLGINRQWKIDIYGIFENVEINYPYITMKKGGINVDKIKEKVRLKDKKDPFYYIDKHLIVRVTEKDKIKIGSIKTKSMVINLEYELGKEEKLMIMRGELDGIVELDKTLDIDNKVYRIVRELNKPPTLLDIGDNILFFKDGKYINMENNTNEICST